MSFIDEVKDRLKTHAIDPEAITPELALGLLYALEARLATDRLALLQTIVDLEREAKRS